MPKSFYIIDGHAHIYRAYFAPFRDLTSPVTGEPTKATYVFTQMLLNLIDQRKPDYLAMVIDSGDETVFRKQIFPEYKANRASRPEDFKPQEERILRIVKDSGLPIFAKPGFEADDLLATMAKQLCGQDYEIFLVSKDKDLRQCVNDCTKMYDVQGDEIIDTQKLIDKLGYGPAQAVDVQSLIGDAIDNVPGIPGVGEKTAAKLINKYGTAEQVLEHADELTPKMKENFKAFGDRIGVARQLVTLKTDVEFDFSAEQCRFKGINTEGLKKHLVECGFTSLLKRIGEEPVVAARSTAAAKAKPQAKYEPFGEGLFAEIEKAEQSEEGALETKPLGTSKDCKYELVNTPDKLAAFLSELRQQKRFAFDTETASLGALTAELVGMSFSWKAGTGYYVPTKGPSGCQLIDCDEVLKAIKPILCDETIAKVGHNLKYDIMVMRTAGLDVRGVVMDSMVAAFLIDASRMQYGIDVLARDLLQFQKIPTVDLIGKGKQQLTMDRVNLDRIACYAAEDADIALRLCDLFEAKLAEMPTVRKLHDELETPLIETLIEMETNGVAVDPAVLKEQSAVLGERIEELRGKIAEAAGGIEFNPDSPKQLGDVLFNKLNLKVVKRTKTGPSTDIEVLEKLANDHPVPKLILEYRSLVKLKNTYLDNLTDHMNPHTGRVHTSFNQTGASTGRLSSSDPNLQNIPIRTDEGRRIRLAFVPGNKDNVLLTADYSQIELRVLAHFTREPALVEAFAKDEDIHRAVASEVFGVPLEDVSRDQRGQAKTINFGIIYGVSAFGLARRIDGMTMQSAQQLINAYNKRFPSIKQFLEKCVMEAQGQGYVETIMGRRRPINDVNSGVLAIRNAGERMAINSVVQGSAADLIKLAMLNVHKRIKREKRPSKMLLQVHDELVFETPASEVQKDAEIVREEMVNAGTAIGITIPLKVELGWGKNWGETK